MFSLDIPGGKNLQIEHVLLDFNGTIAVDGKLITGVGEKINRFAGQLNFHVITADTFGSVKRELEGVNCSVTVIPLDDQCQAKLDLLNELGAQATIAVGNGLNDQLMIKHGALGVAVLQEEGLATVTLLASDLLVHSVLDLFAYLECPERLIACLRC